MAGMTIDFNSVREQPAEAYNALVDTLNTETAVTLCGGKIIEVYPEEIREPLEKLRQMLACICYTFEKDSEESKCIEVDLKAFNEEGEDCGEK